MGIGHVSYATTCSLHVEQCQSLYTNSPFSLAIVHNGNITNIHEIKEIMNHDKRHIYLYLLFYYIDLFL
jgi:amidophosphoribosyltransferase